MHDDHEFRGAEPLYFDNQASTKVDPVVFATMQPYFAESYGNAHSGEHVFGRHAHDAVETARSQVASTIGCEPQDVVFTSGATESNNLAILGVARNSVNTRDTILVSSIEHSSVLESARHSGLRVVHLPVNRDGRVEMDRLRSELSDRVKLVSVGWVNNEIGTIQAVGVIGDHVRAVGALLHVDGAQALTATEIRAADLPIDYLSLSSHKAYGPKGVGALYVAPGRDRYLQPLTYGGGQERGLRAGTLPTPLCVGFGAACALIDKNGETERARVRALRNSLYEQITKRQPNAMLVGSLSGRHPGNLSVSLDVEDARDVLQMLQLELACSTGSACNAGSEMPSNVLLQVGLTVTEARRVLRLGVGRFTTDRDCERAASLLKTAIDGCKR